MWNESHIVWEPPNTPILPQYRGIKGTFQGGGKYTRDSLENSESKSEFFIKYPQAKFYLIGTYSNLDLQVLKFANLF